MKNFIKENPQAVRDGLVQIFETPEGREMVMELLTEKATQEHIDNILNHLYGNTDYIESWLCNGLGEGPAAFGKILCEKDRHVLEKIREDLEIPNISDAVFDMCEYHTPEKVEEQITRWRSYREVSTNYGPSLLTFLRKSQIKCKPSL